VRRDAGRLSLAGQYRRPRSRQIQVTHWRAWAAECSVRFIDGFAPFFREPADDVLRKYFIKGDVHFTDAGNRLLYEEVRKATGVIW
jgi:hypothetical protein